MITGTVTNNVGAVGWEAALQADLKVWSMSNAPSSTVTGLYTMILPGSTNVSVEPGGHGYGLVRVEYDPVKGKQDIKAKGLLGETQKLKPVKVPTSENYRWPFYAPAYKGVGGAYKRLYGSTWGWLWLTNGNVSGDLTWTKRAGWTPLSLTELNLYSFGFSNAVTISGSPYVPPPQPPGVPGAHVIAITNGLATLDDGNLSVGLAQDFEWNDLNKLIFPNWKKTGTNVQNIKFSVVTKYGELKGTFVHPNNPAKPTKAKGAVLQNLDLGFGAFPGTSESGPFVLQEGFVPLPP